MSAKHQIRWDEVSRWDDIFHEEFEKETDRASVILSVAMLDQALLTILKTRLAPSGTTEDELLESTNAPISTFSARVNLAYRIGLISTQFARDLHIVRKIRNDFAHNITGCSFEDTSVRSRILELCRSSGFVEKSPEIRERFCSGRRGDFQMIASWMLWYLRALAESVSPIKAPSLEIHYKPEELMKGIEKSRAIVQAENKHTELKNDRP